MRTMIVCFTALVSSGCVTATDVVKTGPDTYLVVGHASGGMNSGKGSVEAIKKANDYCAAQHLVAKVINMEQVGNASVFGESDNITFKCVAAP
jgi:hypothetical protein